MSPGAGPGGQAAPGIDPRASKLIEHIVQAVRDGNDTRIRTLLADLAALADTAALLHLRERLYAQQ
ncbi:hypothetical protein [Streptomyces sp. NPDC003952]